MDAPFDAALFAEASDLLARYCRGIDAHDCDLLEAVAHPDIELHGPAGQTVRTRGDYLDYFRQAWAKQTATASC
jgi:hypothetical protein